MPLNGHLFLEIFCDLVEEFERVEVIGPRDAANTFISISEGRIGETDNVLMKIVRSRKFERVGHVKPMYWLETTRREV